MFGTSSFIRIKGSKEHNLKNISVDIPCNKIVSFVGVSGSGKSSLAFDTIYAEGRRLYLESLSSYSRRMLGMDCKPNVDFIEGLSPAVAVDQRGMCGGSRSTVATVSEIYDCMRILFARLGKRIDPKTGKVLDRFSIEEIVNVLNLKFKNEKVFLFGVSDINTEKLDELHSLGFTREIDDNFSISSLTEGKNRRVMVDRLTIDDDEANKRRIEESLSVLSTFFNDTIGCIIIDKKKEIFFHLEEGRNNSELVELSPSFFSFSNAIGSCEKCSGLGTINDLNDSKIVSNIDLSISEGAIEPFFDSNFPCIDNIRHKYQKNLFCDLAKRFSFGINSSWKSLPSKVKNIILYGDKEICFPGVREILLDGRAGPYGSLIKKSIELFMSEFSCPVCKGTRLKKEVLDILVNGINIAQLHAMSISEARTFCREYLKKVNGYEGKIANFIIKEMDKRLGFIEDIGLGYLNLNRSILSLSGGERQRMRLASQMGSGLSGITYVLDEPSAGLHDSDIGRLLKALYKLRDLGNNVIIVEHNEKIIKHADWIIEIGPLSGERGGNIVTQGSVSDIINDPQSITGFWMKKNIIFENKKNRPLADGFYLRQINIFNLKIKDLFFPFRALISLVGVSGSGKTTLMFNILNKCSNMANADDRKLFSGLDNIEKVVEVKQNVSVKNSRSSVVTYLNIFGEIRNFFAALPQSRERGYGPTIFSSNNKLGQCHKCLGTGTVKVDMHFFSELNVKCDVCDGSRFKKEVLDVKCRGKSISDILNMTIYEAFNFFASFSTIKLKLAFLLDAGLEYLCLGQTIDTLSGGEIQRLKLSKELTKGKSLYSGGTLYLLDEPTAGLHAHDVSVLFKMLDKLVDAGNTVVVAEHNGRLIRNSDYIIEMGTGGGSEGGKIIACGTPREIIDNFDTPTARFLRELDKGNQYTVDDIDNNK